MTPQELRQIKPAEDALAGRVVLVTGAGDGLGRALALDAAAHGASVILLDKEIPPLESLYDEIEAAGGPQPAIYPMNLEGATVKDYDDMAANIEREFGRLDGLVHNAGWFGDMTPIRYFEPELWSRVMTVNLHAPYLMTQALLPLLEHSEHPSIVFSTHDARRAYWGAYGVAKAGLEALMRILAAEHGGDRRIFVNGIDTGPMRTQLRRRAYPGELAENNPLPETFTAAYVHLLSPACELSGVNFELADTRPAD
ncbi:MAG TPA: SDR family NAD(P)-dependent oxidoreductase [Chromatiales bacterium]|nr:SDR family NAD(P)-dependent oxidoreductase [Chromatiales bacterium]